MTYGFICDCGEELEVDITVTYGGTQGNYSGLPEDSYPGEGAEWHVKESCICEGCGKVWENDNLAEKFEDDIQQYIFEARADHNEDCGEY